MPYFDQSVFCETFTFLWSPWKICEAQQIYGMFSFQWVRCHNKYLLVWWIQNIVHICQVLCISQHLVASPLLQFPHWMVIWAFCPMCFNSVKTFTTLLDLVLTLDSFIWLHGHFSTFQLVKYVLTLLFTSSEPCFTVTGTYMTSVKVVIVIVTIIIHLHHSSVVKECISQEWIIFIIHAWVIWWFTSTLLQNSQF